MQKPVQRPVVAVALACLAAGLSAAAFVRDEPMGRWDIEERTLVSGQEADIHLRYTNGEEALPAGSSFTMAVEPISVTQLQGGNASLGMEAVGGPQTAPRVSVKPVGLVESGAFGVRIALPEGLPAGQVIRLKYGNRQLDGRIVGLVNPVPVRDLAWDVRYHVSDADAQGRSWSEAGWWRSLPRVDIVPAEASALRITAPSNVGIGQPFKVRVAVTDRFDSRVEPPFVGSVRLIPSAGMTGLPSVVRFTSADRSSRVIDGVRTAKAGIYRIGARLLSEGVAAASAGGSAGGSAGASPSRYESNPIVAQSGTARPIRWGILHGRAGYTAGWGDGVDSYYAYARDVAGLDYAALSEEMPSQTDAADWKAGGIYAHRYGRQMDAATLRRVVSEGAARNHRPGEFITILGCLGSTAAAGSHGVYTAKGGVEALTRLVPRSGPAFPFELQAALSAAEPLIIHHTNAAYLPYSTLVQGRTRAGKLISPALECHSERGMAFPGPGPLDPLIGGVRSPVAKPMFRVIGRGLRFGLIGDSGTLTGWPGRRWASGLSPRNRFVQGLTAVRPSSFSREGIIEAYRERDVYATTGERIALDFTINGVGMGRTVFTDGPAVAKVVVSGTADVREISLFSGERVLTQARFAGRRDVRAAFDLSKPTASEEPYMVEVVQGDRHRAWSSPIWVRKRLAPDLMWERAGDGKLYIKNAGSAQAMRVTLQGHRVSYGFVRPGWGPVAALPEGADGQVWLRRWSDRRATLVLAWRGSPLSGSIRIGGQTDYSPEPDYALLSRGGTFRDDGAGVLSFSDTITGGRGVAVNLTVSPKKACSATLTFARDVALVIEGRTEKAREFVIPINSVAVKSAGVTQTIAALRPGEQRAVADPSLNWMADPGDAIAETNEGNNLWVPKRK